MPQRTEGSSSLEKLSDHGEDPRVEVPSSPATELNTMTQGDLDRLREAYSFPSRVRTRIPENGETILSAMSLSLAQRSEIGVGMALLQGEEFHLSIPREEGTVRVPRSWGALGKRYNKVPALSKIEDKRFHWVELRCLLVVVAAAQLRAPPPLLRVMQVSLATLEMYLSPMSYPEMTHQLAKTVAEKVATSSTKGVVISEKRPRDEVSESLSKKRTFDTTGPMGNRSPRCQSSDFAKSANNQHALAEYSELEMVRAINRAIELEGSLVEVSAKEKKAAEEVEARNKEVARLEARVADLENSQALAKGRIIVEFKESEDFQEAVLGSTSSYFGDGFNFCKTTRAPSPRSWH
ncbi:hypothetical protein Acr_00g0020300 [Actinidia rufa]|uniref:Uncharacterized protein n=1 Tax=Actinidia rufa TaxID=165716 RepID=A0A7J0DBY3_9ERIC|nr:hypothetical protein Acr_00g0020300 [Actinidia rufa]